MNEFFEAVLKFEAEAEELQKAEILHQQKARLFTEKLMGFLKQYGLPENFTLPQLMLLAVRKSRD